MKVSLPRPLFLHGGSAIQNAAFASYFRGELTFADRVGLPFPAANHQTLVNRLSRPGETMYHHIKQLMYDVHVDQPDVRFGTILLEQFGGANGELAAAMQYTIQGWSCDDPERKDLLLDIGTEEISHLEVVGALIRMHLKPMKKNLSRAEEDPIVAVTGGGGLNLFNSVGNPWTADYLKIAGELDVDLRNNIAAEARAKITYERLIHLTDDQGSKEALQFLMTREITHMKAFSAALDSLGKDPFSIGQLEPTRGLVNEYYNDSTGDGEVGKDGLGSWIEQNGLHVVEWPKHLESNGNRSNGHFKNGEGLQARRTAKTGNK